MRSSISSTDPNIFTIIPLQLHPQYYSLVPADSQFQTIGEQRLLRHRVVARAKAGTWSMRDVAHLAPFSTFLFVWHFILSLVHLLSALLMCSTIFVDLLLSHTDLQFNLEVSFRYLFFCWLNVYVCEYHLWLKNKDRNWKVIGYKLMFISKWFLGVGEEGRFYIKIYLPASALETLHY